MSTMNLAATVVAGTALVLAPIDPQPIRDLNTPLPVPAPEPEPTPVLNFDNHGTYWGCDTIANTEALIARERAAGTAIDEWHVTDYDGQPLRIVRCADPDFLDTICVISVSHPEPEILEKFPARGQLLGYDRFAITPGAPLPDGRTIATVEDPLGSSWRVTDDQGGVRWLHKHGQLIRYTSGAVTFVEPEWAGWSSD
ncbi:hypothetical protein [Streptomyces sp. SID8352]|uniref:hypothetical protein n=1 Tax=Streptomyces sp. SID8352 TaxID=2690338 RepID=UPI00136ED2BD|nr:hypothetical protein [Streptomyces sp. SID8352]MYU24612.1 hypothetical protein [Streptomyces sp. SID8352]